MSAWSTRSDLKQVLSPTRFATHDACGGRLRDPLVEYRCQEIIRKWPKRLCNTLFMGRESQSAVCKTYCEKHRFCFLPLPDGTRCTNMRREISKKYCDIHISQEHSCGSLVQSYKSMCGEDPLKRRCVQSDDIDLLEEKMNMFRKCRDGRLIYNKQCIHPSAQSMGHLHFLGSIVSSERECGRIYDGLWHDALEYPPDEWSDASDVSDGSDSD